MLTSLHIRNFALIDDLELTFGEGLNILTGETGAGKSIIIDALGTALGERTSSDSIRSGTDRFFVEAVFDLAQHEVRTHATIAEFGLENEDEPNILVLGRELNRAGKNQCRVNGRLVPVATLRAVGADLVDVHGQHEHQSLLSSDTHIDLLDGWLGPSVLSLRSSISEKYDQLVETRRELEHLMSAARDRVRNLDLYRFQIAEIKDAGLSATELSELTQERSRLSNSEKLRLIAEESYESLHSSALSSINTSQASLQRAADIDPELLPTINLLTEAQSYLEEAVTTLRHYRDTLDAEPGRLETINERLDQIHLLQRKYGDTVEEILAYLSDVEQKMYGLEDSEFHSTELNRHLLALQSELNATSETLSKERVSGAVRFANAIEGELKDLGMLQTRFEVSVQVQPLSSLGKDRIEFLISPNPGEPLRPLAKIASGGEASRIMLAIKSVLLRTFRVPTMIFDEIDTGVGGRTGRVIADKLAALSEIAQIMCITHLPQIASRPASAHFLIEKIIVDGRTTVHVRSLSNQERQHEIARMLGGDDSETVLKHAKEMLSA